MSNKIALITGGSRGLGKNTALHLAKQGVGIVLTYRSKEDEAKAVVAEIEAAGGKAATLQLDTSVASSFGRISGSGLALSSPTASRVAPKIDS